MSNLVEVEQYCGVLTVPFDSRRLCITQQQLEEWRQVAVLDALTGITLGRSFCNRFDTIDVLLYYNTLASDRLIEYIQGTYVKK